ncbi:uncharacterized protein N7459_001222 [Penicillium hispanicum]|uniref:uncharacterized protein n=1 Tax=Penicillium hispanicum TaxID=1080232 RepID=UPI002540753D|nr:uncharacterized protein N7459_001222 [Penicillium hispanicum]KAJ5595014.1 hypothetical protein N7459_001222 [Penicillium hispanicum]
MPPNDPIQKFKRIGVVGAGSMGSMMTFAFSELGLDVSVWDVDKTNVEKVLKWAKDNPDVKGKIEGFCKIDDFTKSLEGQGDRKLFMFSITHGAPADSVLSMIKRDLKAGDIILDGGNENYRRTERRQRECEQLGVFWIGMGVSGGYQSARRGPSLSPGGDAKAIELVMPLLEKYAAKDPKSGTPCVTRVGPGGSGHFVKMVHNGIEGGMMSALAEAWSYMHFGLGMGYEEIGDVFAKWNESGELRRNFLIQIGADILKRKRTPHGDHNGEGTGSDGHVLDDVLDKVVQDDDDTEGTPLWSVMESAARHVSSPTLAAAHYLRIASGNRQERVRASEKLQMPSPKPIQNVRDRKSIIEQLRRAVYAAFLASFCQGLELIARASADEGWKIDLSHCLQIWRAGCIIQSEYIADLLQPALEREKQMTNMKFVDSVSRELHNNFDALKSIVVEGTVSDQYMPAISATLDYLKYEGGLVLPTKFMEAQMDYFGAHSYNKPGIAGEDPGPVMKGPHHYEWKVA